MEVIYTGLHQTPEMIATAAVQEDVDVAGPSILGAHMTLFRASSSCCASAGRDDILITGGAILPKEEMGALRPMVIGKSFRPGTYASELIDYIKAGFAEQQEREACAERNPPDFTYARG